MKWFFFFPWLIDVHGGSHTLIRASLLTLGEVRLKQGVRLTRVLG